MNKIQSAHTFAKPALARTVAKSGMRSTQPTLPVQPNDRNLMIMLSLIFLACVGLIGIAFYVILGL